MLSAGTGAFSWSTANCHLYTAKAPIQAVHVLYAGTGAISWFPVHCTSINNTNDLISGDNKGVASQYLEKWAVKQSTAQADSQEPSQLQVTRDFVAAFGQANVGDTSPNIQGAFCQDTGPNILRLSEHTCVSCLHLFALPRHCQDTGFGACHVPVNLYEWYVHCWLQTHLYLYKSVTGCRLQVELNAFALNHSPLWGYILH